MEGVMMKNQDNYAIAVRTPQNKIEIEKKKYQGAAKNKKLQKIPLVRGVVNFVDSLVLGMSSLTFSASFYEDEEPKKEELTEAQKAKKKKTEDAQMGATVALSILLAIAIFMILPLWLSRLFAGFGLSETWVAVLEGVFRLLIFFAYMIGISFMKDIQRVFMYHGAEHKCINCIEHGMDLTVENVRKSSRLHKRCGTSFLFLVIIISVVLFIFIRVDSPLMRVVVRLLLIPVIAGIAYEFIRLAGKTENPLVAWLSKPGLLLQRLTTREPDDDMIEVGIASVEAVFDWKTFVEEVRNENENEK